MSYHLSVNRVAAGNSKTSPISKSEWLSCVEDDDDFSCIIDEGDSVSALFQQGSRAEELSWCDGVIDVYQPSDVLLQKLARLATSLNATVVNHVNDAQQPRMSDMLSVVSELSL
ncbi:hypothetical protein GCM10008090_22380 [Arenicella chitinivorans]|uniref:Uncharacterized protein n=1 Tax=Arenicella chitinivorans TaxID=1329800 RepID=A0A918RWJ9_9GAMM|nr:hypothetical protein [Arenicella chitinivorans]GHA12061.1 hypothetical protein GCM10008090_22380 [Arenicella chitinivorans]